jgi:tetratricopeptide (TPR) repeat protein
VKVPAFALTIVLLARSGHVVVASDPAETGRDGPNDLGVAQAVTPAPSGQAATPTSVRDLLQTARRQLQGGDASGALESLRQARALAPNSEEVLSAFAQVALGARMLSPAIATLDTLTRMCPTVSQYHYLLGVALMEGGDMLAAVESLQQADRLEPERPLTLTALGLAQNSRKQYNDARRALIHALDLEPENVDALAALAEAEAGVGELAPAEDHARRVLARSDTHPTANLVMGIVLMKREQYAAARDALNKAIAADPGSSAAYYQLSLADARLGDEANARQHVELYQQKLREAQARIHTLRATSAERPR